MKRIRAADLFCGAGGTSTGLHFAAETLGRKVELVAVNHWHRAVETHAKNHPSAGHFCEDLTTMDPRKAVPSGKLDLLVASPECTHHSVARGGKPVNDQSRASAWCVMRWCTALQVDRVIIENVPEFLTWGPIGSNGKPLKTRRGETFTAFVQALRSLGYHCEWKVLNAADHGGATTRRRLFLQAARGRRAIRWPAATHEPEPRPGLFGILPRWKSARNHVIDWSLRGTSIFGRKRPLAANTLLRIEAGLRKFGGKAAEPFLVILRRNMHARSIDAPLPTLTAGAEHVGLCEPFLVDACHGGDGHDRRAHSVDKPMGTQHAGGNRFGIVEPFLMGMSQSGSNGSRLRSVDEPLNTITTADDFVPTNYGEREGQSPRCHSIDKPAPTVVAGNTHALVEPFILPHRQFTNMTVDDIDRPLRTILASPGNGGCMGLVEPFFVPYYANGEAESIDDPLRTITTHDRFGLVTPDGRYLDILFRMLQPHELAAGMGFPKGYVITGNRSEQVRQIGNAVEVNQARALCMEAMAS